MSTPPVKASLLAMSAGVKAGCAPGILTGDADLAQRYIDLGCLFAAVGSDIGLLAKGADQLAAKFRGQNPGR